MAGPAYDDRDGQIWYDGKLVAWRDAQVHLLTHALHYGSGVFEGVRMYGGKIFKLREHSERLIESAKIMGFEIPYDVDAIDAACVEACKANNITDGYLRPDRKSTRLNSSHITISYAVFCLKKKKKII